MKQLLFIAAIFLTNIVAAQTEIDTTITVDLLKAPVSPASNLLGFSPSDIDKPTDVSAFMLSLQSATNSYSKLPSSYAVDIAPYWLFKNSKKGDITTKGFRESAGKDVLKQTFVLSFAFKNPDSAQAELNSTSAYGAIGFKFSILRGNYDAATNQALDRIKALQDTKLRHLDKIMSAYKESQDPEIADLRKKRKDLFKGFDVNDKSPENQKKLRDIFASNAYLIINSQLQKKLNDIVESGFSDADSTQAVNELDKKIQQEAVSFQTARTGLTWDVSGGISTEFRNKRFDNSKVYNAGIWTTVGYTDTTYGAGLLLARFLKNPDKVFAKDNLPNTIGDISTFDVGFRYIYARPQSKFNASLEAIYRSILSSNTIKPSWRLVMNADYNILPNKKLTFSFGRNFDGTITKDGNLVAALTLLTGFGNKR